MKTTLVFRLVLGKKWHTKFYTLDIWRFEEEFVGVGRGDTAYSTGEPRDFPVDVVFARNIRIIKENS